MRRFLALYLLLAPVYFLARVSVSALLFQRVDLRFTAFFELLLVPALQALVLTWLASGRRLSGREALRAARENRFFWPLVALNVAVLVVGTVLPGMADLPRRVAGIEALAAALLLVLFWRAGSAVERVLVWLVSAGLAAYGFDAFFPWIRRLPELLLPQRPQALRWLIVYGGLFILAIGGLTALGARLERRSLPAAVLLDLSVGFALVSAAVVVLNIFLRPVVLEPWASVTRACSFLSVAALLLCASQLASESRTVGRLVVPSAGGALP